MWCGNVGSQNSLLLWWKLDLGTVAIAWWQGEMNLTQWDELETAPYC